eukprot:2128807-Amphidinium_carterae.2
MRKRKYSSKVSGDFLVQNLFLTASNGRGGWDQCVLTNVPIPLAHGKGTWAIAGCASSLPCVLMCKSGGELRFMCKHVVMDRAVSVNVARYLSGLWMTAETQSDDQGVSAEDRWLLEIHTHVGCAAHDCHNSLKWSLCQFYDNSEVLSNIHVALEALKVGAAHASKHLWEWLQSVLAVRAVDKCMDEDTLHKLWCVLGVDANIVSELVGMRLLWRNESLEISEEFLKETGDAWLPKLSSVLVELWHLGSFCGSRWCTLGSACRSYCAAALSGFLHMFGSLCKGGVITAYEQHGGEKLDEVGKTCVVCTALVAWIPESLLFSVLHDSRLALKSSEYRRLLEEEVDMLESLPDTVFAVLSSLLSQGVSSDLKSQVLSASLACQSYLHMRVWSVLQEYPWCLCGQDPAGRVKELLELSEPPDDCVASKLWALGASGMASIKIVEMLELLSQVAWTSHTAEKQHASAAQVKKYHPEITTSTLAQRAFIHGCRELLPADSVPDQRVAKLQQHMQKLIRYRPSNIGPRQVYYADMLQKLKKANAESAAVNSSKRFIQENVMSLHAAYFAQLHSDAVKRLNERAAHVRELKKRETADDLEACQLQLQQLLLQHEESDDRECSGALKLSRCKLDADRWKRVGECYTEFLQQKHRVLKTVAATASDCPHPVHASEYTDVLQRSIIPPSETITRTEQYKLVCRLRQYFRHAVLGFIFDDGVMWGRVALLRLSPFYLGMQILKKLQVPKKKLPHTQDLDQAGYYTHVHAWELTDDHTSADVFGEPALLDACVCMNTTCVGNKRIHSFHDVVPLASVLRSLERDVPVQRRRAAADDASQASGNNAKRKRAQTSTSNTASASSAGPPDTLDASDILDAAVDSEQESDNEGLDEEEHAWDNVYKTVEMARQGWREAWGDTNTWFRSELSGGAWQMERTGREVYGTRINVKPHSPAHKMATRFNMPLSASFEINVYGNETGTVLAQIFEHVMSHYTVCWLESGEPELWDAVELTEVVLPPHLLIDESASNTKTKKRLRELLAIRPNTRKKRSG